jgi:serine/threonine protein phosphatase PrpC
MRPRRAGAMALYRAVKLCLDDGEAQEGGWSMARWLPSFRRSPSPAPAPAPAEAKSAAPPARSGFRIESWSRTHEGRVRSHNEDSYVAREDAGLWAVADGMGGHEGGEWASGRIVRELGGVETDQGFEASCKAATEAVLAANRQILAEGRKRGKRMGSTLVMLIVEGPRYAILWAGDSRAYLMRGGKLVQLSRDHTQVQEMVSRGLMTAEQALGHPMGHILSRAVGVQKDVEVDRADGEVQSGDIFLLCSDGLHGVVNDEEIAGHFAREAPERALDQLIELTLANGAPDNVTGIAVWASDPTLLSFADPKP